MKKYLIVVLVMISTSAFCQDLGFSGKKVLIYTKNGEGYVHDNIAASVEALEEICAGMSIKTTVSDDPALFDGKKIHRYDAIIFSNSNNEAFENEQQRENFQKYIRSGKGFMTIHSACASERDWPWFWALVGGTFVRHPPLQEFDIKIIDDTHISTTHLPEIWKWEDECYYLHQLNPAIHVLLAVDLTTIEDKSKDKFPGTIFGDLFPLAWCHEFEGGRSFYTGLGHKIEYYKDENFRKHLAGGIVWVLEQ